MCLDWWVVFCLVVFCVACLVLETCSDGLLKFKVNTFYRTYVGVLINFWIFLFPIFLFATQPKEFLLDGLQKLEQRSRKCEELRGEYVE
jgi:hypothetical protein